MTFTTKSNKQLINDLQTDVNVLVGASGLEIDETPTQNSLNAVTSNGVYDAFANIDLSAKQDTINSTTNLTVNELSAGVTKIRDFGLTTTSGDLNLHSKSGRINLLSTNIKYDVDILGNSANLKDTLDSKQPNISQGSPLAQNKVDGLETALNSKATITQLNLKQNIITDNSLTISQVNNLQTQLDSKKSNFSFVAGNNITIQNGISQNGDVITISATNGSGGGNGVTYTEGSNIDITADDVIKVEENPTFNTIIAGATKIGGEGSALFSQSSFTSWEDAALIQWSSGHTIINCKLNSQIYFRNGGVGNRTFAKIDNTGEFHIYRDGSLQNLNTLIDSGGGTTYQAGEGINIIDDVISSSLISDTNDYLEILFSRFGHMQDSNDNLPTAYSFFGHSFTWTPQGYAIRQDLYGETRINSKIGKPIKFCINNVEKMTLDSDGTALIVGNAKIGYCGHSDNVAFSHYNHQTSTNYGFMHNTIGASIINSAAGQDIWFRNSNNNKMVLKSNGRLGIGTNNPGVALDVFNPIDYHTWGTYFDEHNNWVENGPIHGTARLDQTRKISIMGRGILSWNGFFSASDSRFKTNIQDIDDSSALDLLRNIKPKTYEYIDKVDRGGETVYGFIAQDIAESFPNASSIQREKIPNIYELGTKAGNVITLTNKSTDLLEKDAEGVIYKTLLVYHPDGLKIELTIKSITDDKHIVIESTDELDVNCELFIFGQVVDNFHTIDKNYIFTIATAALQEVDRQLQEEKTKTASLESKLESIKRLKIKDQTLPSKINFITAAYFNGYDLKEKVHLIIIIDTEIPSLRLDPKTIYQIHGRLRNGAISAQIVVDFKSQKYHNYNVEILDAEAENFTHEQTAESIANKNPKLAVFVIYGQQPSASTQCMPAGTKTCNKLKLIADGQIKTLVMGTHASALPKRTLEEEPYDFVCQGEGPITISNLIDAIKNNKKDYDKFIRNKIIFLKVLILI
jgi:hypothetical protein